MSLKSGRAVLESLSRLGLDAAAIDIKTDRYEDNARLLKSRDIDCAFVALHGKFGEDGGIQEILDDLNIPYTGSGVSASRLAMDKIASRRIFQVYGLSVPGYEILNKFFYNKNRYKYHKFNFPLVVKPATNGSSIGLSIVEKPGLLDKAIKLAFDYDDNIILEEYIKGRELTVAILNDKALPVIEIVPKRKFFDYQAKYKYGLTEYLVPAPLSDGVKKKVQLCALKAHRILGCFGCSRVDIMLDDRSRAYVLEVNTIPGLTQTSLLPKAASKAGIDFAQLVLKLVGLAYAKN
ncbi:MAG: D-alanine--D-alanine ligase [Candidatus Omnitrophica bacterium]|nr:D-alanine--D-alanine ligase [Candidatus Omnitrophota bacterium]